MITHRFEYTEVGRDEDDVALDVGCPCGWREEIATTKYDMRQDAQRTWNGHLVALLKEAGQVW